MKIVCVADAYVTRRMMEEGITPYLKDGDSLSTLFFGESNRIDMRDTVKAIESMKYEQLDVPKELDEEIVNCDLLIVHLCPVTRLLIKKAKNLKAILSCRGGVENIDIVAATENKIIVATNPAHNANAVAEYTIGLIICETRNIARADRALRDGIWREKYPNTSVSIRELKNLTIGIVGFGSVGRLVAEKLSVFNCNILICDPYLNESAYDFINFKFVDMTTLLRKSDIVTLHARSKVPIMGSEEFSLMKNGAYLINTARSILVDPKALRKALDENKITGAAFDVFETEPIIPEFYKKYDNITITNHRGGDTIESYQEAPGFAIRNYLNYLSGGRLKFWYNKNQLQ